MSYEEAIDYVQNFMQDRPSKVKELALTDGIDRSRFAKDDIRCEVGLFWYAFAGGKFSSNPKAYPNCQGVVGWINPDPNAPEGNRIYIVLPEQNSLKYSYEYCKTGVDDLYDGRANTKKLLEYGRKHGVKFPAAEFAFNYTKNGVKKGEAFLPAREQLVRLCENTKKLRKSLKKIGGTFEGFLLSSSECNLSHAWRVHSSSGLMLITNKGNDANSVSCLLAY